jgi:DNA-binding transcriptional ArsR family regulator
MNDKLRSDECARSLKAIGDPERLKIIQCLQPGPRNVSELAALLGVELANVSHHLRVLRDAGLVLDEKQGKFVVYSLNPTIFKPGNAGHVGDALDLGCCRLELTGET